MLCKANRSSPGRKPFASVEVGGVWYCSTACAAGRPTGEERRSAVPEAWLYPVPRRFYGKRKQTELRSNKPSS